MNNLVKIWLIIYLFFYNIYITIETNQLNLVKLFSYKKIAPEHVPLFNFIILKFKLTNSEPKYNTNTYCLMKKQYSKDVYKNILNEYFNEIKKLHLNVVCDNLDLFDNFDLLYNFYCENCDNKNCTIFIANKFIFIAHIFHCINDNNLLNKYESQLKNNEKIKLIINPNLIIKNPNTIKIVIINKLTKKKTIINNPFKDLNKYLLNDKQLLINISEVIENQKLVNQNQKKNKQIIQEKKIEQKESIDISEQLSLKNTTVQDNNHTITKQENFNVKLENNNQTIVKEKIIETLKVKNKNQIIEKQKKFNKHLENSIDLSDITKKSSKLISNENEVISNDLLKKNSNKNHTYKLKLSEKTRNSDVYEQSCFLYKNYFKSKTKSKTIKSSFDTNKRKYNLSIKKQLSNNSNLKLSKENFNSQFIYPDKINEDYEKISGSQSFFIDNQLSNESNGSQQHINLSQFIKENYFENNNKEKDIQYESQDDNDWEKL
jgi:hypothetical protein